MKTKESKHLTLKDRLSRLTYLQACKLLGPQGAELIRQGSGCEEVDLDRDVYLRGDLFRVKFPACQRGKNGAVVTITTMAAARQRLRFNCTACATICRHVGAAVSLILEEKTALGLAAPPDESVPLENLSESELIEAALRERQERAQTEKFRLRSADPAAPWTDYTVTAPCPARPTAWRCAARTAASRIAPVPISAPTPWAPASTCST